ncbi:RNA-directed DNA polymerase, eukaryota, partial [Tanacetum coccineum]
WGEVIELEDNKEDCFARKRICIKTKLEDNILEKFKIIVRGKIFVIRAKKLFVWSPTFNDNKEVDDYSEDDSVNGAEEINGDISKQMNLDDETDIEGVSDTVFDDKADSLGHEHTQNLSPNEKENSSDPFNLYNLLNKRDKGEANSGLDSSIPFPPGFTPEREFQHVDAQEVQGMENSLSKRRSEGLSSRVLEDAQPLNEHASPSIDSKKKQVARYWRSSRWFQMNCLSLNVQGLGSKAKKDWIKELNNKHKVNFLSVQETKLDCISDMDVKVLWGNYKFEYTISEAVGNSGGILCVWDPSVFRKEHHVVSDNFVALYGSWVSNQAKLLVVSIYAPQSITSKRSLWSYISSLISRWDGHCMVMGDFNEVRCMEDRLGSVYNAQGANEFNSFISNSGLVEIQLEGYSFTWSLQSAKKMSKLDRFFVSDGLLSLFPHLSGICLDRHLSDHRPILLREVVTDYGPSPFRVYHSWFSLQGFDQMVSETWNNIDLDDNNKMVRFKKKLQILKKEIRSWVNDCKKNQSGRLVDLRSKLCHIDKVIDQGGVNDDILLTRGLLRAMKTQIMNCLSLNVQGLGSKAKKDWIKELNNKHKVNFLSVQETKLDCISDMDVKVLWGNYKFEYTISEAVGNSGGILCVWDPSVFRKEHHVVSDNFVALYGSWVSNQAKLLVVSIYAPHSITSKRSLWSYISSFISRWDGNCMVMGDFNEVRCMEDRLGSVYNAQGANEFNSFISNSGLVEIQLEGYSFTWSLQSAKKMSKLDHFFVSDGLLSLFPHLSGICLDRHLSDHRPILLREVVTDYGPSPFRVYHSWFSLQGFDQMVSETWNNIDLDDNNKMVRFKKKLQILKKEIRSWVNDCKKNQSGRLVDLRSKLCHIDKVIDQGGVNDDILLTRLDLLKKLHDIKSSDARDYMQKAKIQWAIEGDENSNFFHGIINRKRANLAIKGVMVDGEWVDDPCRVKEEFRLHFANRFRAPAANRCKLNYTFPNRLSSDQLDMLESPISRDEVRNAVWGCGENKSPGPDGFTFEFFRKFWDTLGSDFCAAVEWFFDHSSFSRGCNSSFIALIPKNHDPKFVNDYRPISLIGSLYKVVTKILATRLSSIISGLISDVQTAFLPNRQILDGPFIINELLSWCKHKKQQAMVFKVDFAKAYDSIRWDFLEDVLRAFGFGSKWCSWIRGCLHSGMASVLLNGSPTSEFQFHCGLKQGDPLAPYLFILIMESLHLSLSRAIEAGIFKGIKIGSSLNISHLFYADDAVFIGEWSIANLSGITHILHCFSLLSGLSINLKKSHLLGVGIRSEDVNAAALYFGCSTMKTPFKYLGVMVGGNSSTFQAWDDTIGKLKARLSNWKLKTLSVGGRLTLLKSVLGIGWVVRFKWEGAFRGQDVRILLDECFLPKAPTATRWVKYVPIKINVFAWKVFLDRLPTRSNLQHRGVLVSDLLCPLCSSTQEIPAIVLQLQIAMDIGRLVCAGGIYHGRPLVHMLIGLIGSIPSD